MPRILCVHDDPSMLERVRRALLERERDWEVRLATSVENARETFAQWPADAVVATVSLSLDGVALLTHVRDKRPETVRIALGSSGHEEQGLRAMKIAHRGLPEGAGDDALIEALRRSLLMREMVAQPALRAMLGQIGQLPSVPGVYLQLTQLLDDPSVSVGTLAELVSEDAALAAHVLRFANSAYFGRDQTMTSLAGAAARLGTRLLRSLVLTAEVYMRFPVAPALVEALEQQRRHASLVARIASSLEPRAPWREDAFTAGLLHDVGKLVLATRLPDTFLRIAHEAHESGRPECELEIERFGVHHGTLGASLLGMWGLPSVIIDAVRSHHDPAPELPHVLDAVCAVGIADRLAHAVTDLALQREGTPALPVAVVTDPRWAWWREMADQLVSEGAAAS